MPKLSIVVPVYHCANCLTELSQRIQETIKQITPSFEIIFVEDRGKDASWDLLKDLAKNNQFIKAIRLSRNFGQQAAITTGLTESSGDWIVVMDCDLQDPPEEIFRLYQKACEGFDIVLARRKGKQHSLFRKIAAKLYFGLMNLCCNSKLDGEFGSFSIISRKVVEAFLKFQDQDRHYLFILNWLGFKTAAIDYVHAKRFAGSRSSYNFKKLVKLAFDGVAFQTTLFLRWIVYLGFVVSIIGLLLACYYIYRYYFYSTYTGWTTLVVLILIIGGFIITSTGVTGLYIGKMFDQVKGRPLFVIDEKIMNEDKQ